MHSSVHISNVPSELQQCSYVARVVTVDNNLDMLVGPSTVITGFFSTSYRRWRSTSSYRRISGPSSASSASRCPPSPAAVVPTISVSSSPCSCGSHFTSSFLLNIHGYKRGLCLKSRSKSRNPAHTSHDMPLRHRTGQRAPTPEGHYDTHHTLPPP